MSAPTLQVVVPMGGLGTRFRRVGVTTPKPLIDVDGVPMVARALASLRPWPGPLRVVAVLRADDDAEHGLAGAVREAVTGAGGPGGATLEVVLLHRDTRGAVETVLEAAPLLDPEGPVVVMDCDIAFEAPGWFPAVREAAESGSPDGLLLSFASDDPRFSYAEVDASGAVTRTAEKRVISPDALMGVYTFTRAATLVERGRALLDQQLSATMPEYYVSLLFNGMVAAGQRVGLVRGAFTSFGTPEELAAHLAEVARRRAR